MIMPRTISLTEYKPATFSAEEISVEEGESIWQKHHTKVDIEFPSPKTKGDWRLSCCSWTS